jgi:hypothetical protein
MSDLHLVIKGLAFCRTTSATTQILFPHAPGHQLKATIIKSSSDGEVFDSVEYTLPGENFIIMTADSGVTAAQPNGSVPGSQILDLIRFQLDNTGPYPSSKPHPIVFKPRGDVRKRIKVSYLSIPTPYIYSTSETAEHEFWAHRTKDKNTSTRAILPVVKTLRNDVSVDFRLPSTGADPGPALSMYIQEPLNHIYSFSHQPDTANGSPISYDLTLDNHCHSQACGSDFGYYYEMLDAVDTNGYNVEIEEFPVLRPGSVEVNQEFEDAPDPDSEAACNPVTGDTGEDLEAWYHHH